jgi:dATP pyrophosphohydrolase
MSRPKVVDVYPYCKEKDEINFLLLKRSSDKIYGGQWRMIGGKVQPGEKAYGAAFRELKEETGLTPVQMWTVPSVNHFYNPESDEVLLIPVFAVEVDPDSVIKLDDEHISFKWVSYSEICEYGLWPEQLNMISHIHRHLTIVGKPLPEWIIEH